MLLSLLEQLISTDGPPFLPIGSILMENTERGGRRIAWFWRLIRNEVFSSAIRILPRQSPFLREDHASDGGTSPRR